MMHNSIQGWQRRCRTQPGVRVWRRGNPFFHFLFFPLTTDLQNWEERCFAFGRNRKLAEKMGLSKRCLQNINNAWGLVTVIICRWNLLLMGWEKHKGSTGGSRGQGSVGGHEAEPPLLHILLPGCGHPVLRPAPLAQVRVGRDTCILGGLGEGPHVKTRAIPYPSLISRQQIQQLERWPRCANQTGCYV